MKTANQTETATRYVMTFVSQHGHRELAEPMQGRFTYETREDAQSRMEAMLKGTSDSTIDQVFGKQAAGTFEIRPCDCHADHHDPVGRFFS